VRTVRAQSACGVAFERAHARSSQAFWSAPRVSRRVRPVHAYIGGYYVATGTHRGTLDDPRCAWPNEQMSWSDTSNKLSWMESVIRQTCGASYSCARVGAGADAYMRCL
jgi:hypothetical protein